MAGQLERLALLGLTRREQLSTDWVDESQHGGMIMAVLGHLQTGDRELLAGLAAAGAERARHRAGRLDVGARRGRLRAAGDGLAARARLEGHHPGTRHPAAGGLAGAGAMNEVWQERWSRGRMGTALLALATGWVALIAWSGMVAHPRRYLVATLLIGARDDACRCRAAHGSASRRTA